MLFRSKPVACVLILLTLSGALGSWHEVDDHDNDAQALLHDHSAHHERLVTPTPQAPSGHCALCHWLRAFGTGAPRGAELASFDSPRLLRQSAAVAHLRLSDRLDLPPRAPPLA